MDDNKDYLQQKQDEKVVSKKKRGRRSAKKKREYNTYEEMLSMIEELLPVADSQSHFYTFYLNRDLPVPAIVWVNETNYAMVLYRVAPHIYRPEIKRFLVNNIPKYRDYFNGRMPLGRID